MTTTPIARLTGQHRRFLAFVERRVHSRELAEDILQDAYARALAHGDALRDSASVNAWFFRVLRNALIDHARRRGAEGRALTIAAAEPSTSTHAPDPGQPSVCRCVGDLIDTLKPEYAAAVRSVDLDERSVADYAHASGITSNNASVRLRRAREALHRRVVSHCGACAAHGCLDCRCRPHALPLE